MTARESEQLLARARDAFLGVAAHEMRTPLAVIRGNAELLLEDGAVTGNAHAVAKLNTIEKHAARLFGIVNDFLDVQSLEAGTAHLHPEALHPASIIAERVAACASAAAEREVAIIFDREAAHRAVPSLVTDERRFAELCGRAILRAVRRADRHGTVTVALAEDGGKACFSIRDDGSAAGREDELSLCIALFLAHMLGGEGAERPEKSAESGHRGSVLTAAFPR